jgi:predicted ABC-type ATPase
MPRPFIIGGCNGAGKTTASKTIFREILECEEFINADEIVYALSPMHPELVAMRAGRIMLKRIAEHTESGIDFAFETTLSTRSYAPMMREAKQRGYTIVLIYIYLESEELAIQRVADQNGKLTKLYPPTKKQ